MTFIESPRFPEDISYGSAGGPAWATETINLSSGHEQRNQNWSTTRHKFDVAYGVVRQQNLIDLKEFFIRCRGKLYGFRFKDWSDYEAIDEILSHDGSATVQLTKTYAEGLTGEYVRIINKPVSPTVVLKNNGGVIAGTVDYTTGIVTLDPLWTGNISNITQANPGVVTVAGHGRSSGDMLYLSDIVGMTELNSTLVIISVIDADSFSIGVDTSGYGAYSSSGTAKKFSQPSDVLTWSGEFDVPCRFDTDALSIKLEHFEAGSASVPIVELKI